MNYEWLAISGLKVSNLLLLGLI